MWFWPKHKDHKKAPAKASASGQRASGAHSKDSGTLSREVAGVATDLYEPLVAYLGVRPNRDPLLAHQVPGSSYVYPYGLFEEALDKDAHLTAVVAQRKAAVLAWERRVIPADSSPAAAHVAEFVEEALAGISRDVGGNGHAVQGGFERDLSELLDAIPFGFAVSEVMWERPEGSRPQVTCESGKEESALASNLSPVTSLVPKALKSRHPRRFTFTADGELRLLTAAEPVQGEAVPKRKFLVFAPYGRHENPYGYPQLRSVWWLTYFKRQVLKFWVMYCEKFGTPTVVLKHPLGATDREKKAYRRIVGAIQQETGLVVPEGVEMALLEAKREGSVATYRDLVEFCNNEMSKAILGQTLTTEPGKRGARSLGEVHKSVREDIVRQDAQALMTLVEGQLIPWIVDLNFPPKMRLYPSWRLSPPKQEDLSLQLDIDEFFAGRGLPVDEVELYARYGRKKAAASES